jgi:hypothetical protein
MPNGSHRDYAALNLPSDPLQVVGEEQVGFFGF